MSGERGDEDGGWRPVPALYDGPEGRPGPVLLTLEVDGEAFALRRGVDGGSAYEWLSGPNDGYGFATSGPVTSSVAEHRDTIRSFLEMIDPATGYIADD